MPLFHVHGAAHHKLLKLYDLRYLVPLTPLGLAVICAAGWVYFQYGAQQTDYVLHAGALVALLLTASAAVMVLAVTLVLSMRLRRSREASGDLTLESGVRAVTGYSFPRFGVWPMVQVRLEWADPPTVKVGMAPAVDQMQEVVTPRQRGSHAGVRRRYVVRDIFGLTRLGIHRSSSQRVRILPGPAKATAYVATHFISGEGLSHPTGPAAGELLDMRRYSYGDPLRHVMWKAFARTRQLLVRAAERAIISSPSATAFLVAGPEDEPTASAARLFIEQGFLGPDFLFGADGSADITSRRSKALELIVQSVGFRRQGGAHLKGFLHKIRHRHHCVVLFVPRSPGPWLRRVAEEAPRMGGATAIMAVDDDVVGARPSLIKRAFFYPTRAQRSARTAVPQVVRRLTGCGIKVQVLHRPTGELIPMSKLVGSY